MSADTLTAPTPPRSPLSWSELGHWERALENMTTGERLHWFAETVAEPVFATSFGVEDMVLLDILHQAGVQGFRIVTLDTGRLPQATYDLMDRVIERYPLPIDVIAPEPSALSELLRTYGPNGFYRSIEARKACCEVRKVQGLRKTLARTQGWVTGLRRQQAATRLHLPFLQLDMDHGGILKLNPLLQWTEDEVWTYVRENDVPYNRLHDEGYPSIGCAPCTRAIRPGEDIRAGRWWWENPETKECGLHLAPQPT